MTELAAEAILTQSATAAQTFARNDLRSSAVLERFVGGLVAAMNGAGYVGLRNHGMTITGHSLDDIFDRFGSAIVPRVPME